jgi:hypothetical protein
MEMTERKMYKGIVITTWDDLKRENKAWRPKNCFCTQWQVYYETPHDGKRYRTAWDAEQAIDRQQAKSKRG